ncbi:MAG: nucleotidyltransferase family protein, partial [Desulfocapsaceae bacterium]|nr:nucleotidyltransferase family protein [Desulfocapsaceae bacterium]
MMQAMILAAGFGTRLKPYSLVKPKPLFPVLNVPLLRVTIDRLRSFGFSSITVNSHYLHEQIRAETARRDGIILQEEQTILGTGGGLRQALDNLENEPLLVTNGDIYHSIDFKRVYDYHLEHEAEVTMVLHDCSRFNTVSVADGQVTGFHRLQHQHQRAYTGIQVIDPAILWQVAAGKYSCIIDLYRQMLAAGRVIHCFHVDDIFWSDMGTIEDYLGLHELLLSGNAPIWPEFRVHPKDSILIDNDCV